MTVTFRRATNRDCAAEQRVIDGALREYGLHVELDGADADLTDIEGSYDARGGAFEMIEADSAATLARTTAPWAPWLRFTSTPILPIEESSALAGEAVAFRDSVG